MDSHIKVIGVLWIVLGVISLGFGLLVLLVLMGVSFIPALHDSLAITPGVVRIIAYAVSSVLALFGLPKVIAGIGLLKRREWARIMTIVLAFLEMWNVPLGLALSVYSLIILFNPETIKLFNPAYPRPAPPA